VHVGGVKHAERSAGRGHDQQHATIPAGAVD
jgi:hypothetical protein